MDERRYNEEEVAEIFRAATEGTPSVPSRQPGAEGLTLAELQDIAQDVGIAPHAVAQAAISLDVRAHGMSRKLLGFPIGVGPSVELNRLAPVTTTVVVTHHAPSARSPAPADVADPVSAAYASKLGILFKNLHRHCGSTGIRIMRLTTASARLE